MYEHIRKLEQEVKDLKKRNVQLIMEADMRYSHVKALEQDISVARQYNAKYLNEISDLRSLIFAIKDTCVNGGSIENILKLIEDKG